MFTSEQFNRWRVFPRLGMIFMTYMFVQFHLWFTDNGHVKVTDLSEWALVGYGTVTATYVGLWKFYFESGCTSKGNSDE